MYKNALFLLKNCKKNRPALGAEPRHTVENSWLRHYVIKKNSLLFTYSILISYYQKYKNLCLMTTHWNEFGTVHKT